MKTTMARFPFQKSLDSFDFKFQPSIDPKVIRELATGRFIADADNVLLLGPPESAKRIWRWAWASRPALWATARRLPRRPV